tara:strand:- start:371 stop:1039 length:669 start_codon:yes stop_codon:yes gene_type:complete
MSDSIMDNNSEATEPQQTSQEATKTYTQEEFDRHMSGMRKSIENKFSKQYEDLGDLTELRELKQTAAATKEAEAFKRGEFEKILQEKMSFKDAEIHKRDAVIKEYKVDAPLLNAASKYRSVNPEQVKALLKSQVTLDNEGNTIVTDTAGTPKFQDNGSAYSVDDLVNEFLNANQHFVQPTPSSTNTRSSVADNSSADFDISRLDMSNPADRQKYAAWRSTNK